ncbi:hypothetical protein Y032_0378g298 [Ancylostoma ceylanicum]|uniref:Uncharacterized protein n=1 Tax=Ancylostoma ceylanicum TaxID=53326 RepID=A0A016RTH6_9BILA|nr:hypothetical protein Y032_0378g298 [Ancylostoma ceylanicum]
MHLLRNAVVVVVKILIILSTTVVTCGSGAKKKLRTEGIDEAQYGRQSLVNASVGAKSASMSSEANPGGVG